MSITLSRKEIQQAVDQLSFQRLRAPEQLPSVLAFPIGDDNSALRIRSRNKQRSFEDKILCVISYFLDHLVRAYIIEIVLTSLEWFFHRLEPVMLCPQSIHRQPFTPNRKKSNDEQYAIASYPLDHLWINWRRGDFSKCPVHQWTIKKGFPHAKKIPPDEIFCWIRSRLDWLSLLCKKLCTILSLRHAKFVLRSNR